VKLRPWQAALIAVLVIGAVVGIYLFRRGSHYDAAGLLGCLPPDRAVKVYLDVSQLRYGGLLDMLAGSAGGEEAEYRKFVEDTGFDYRKDVNAVAAAFLHGDIYLAVQGRFDWKRLEKYAEGQKGTCASQTCTMPSSQSGRHISFYPVSSDVLAWAISAEERGVRMIAPEQTRSVSAPAAPVWISAPGFAFADLRAVPAGVRSFLSPLADAQEAQFTAQAASSGYEIRLDATCASPEIAAKLTSKFSSTTDLLKSMIERQKMKANPGDLSGTLVAGKFEAQSSHMKGSWPVDRKLVETMMRENSPASK
jgi:hypothetical protein